jgi:probable addiction module antidote protein
VNEIIFVVEAAPEGGLSARARGMAQVARAAGLSRESLYRALSAGGNPSFATILRVTKALGVRLHAEPA